MKQILTSLILFSMLFSVNARSMLPTFVQDTTTVSNKEVDYRVSQDQSHLYLNISTSDSKTILSMLNQGVAVYFDIKGKKKEKVSIKYPLTSIGSKPPSNNRVEEDVKPSEESKAMKNRIAKLFEKDLPLEAEYIYFDSEQKFNVVLNSLDIDVSFTYDRSKELLEYNLKIPKNKINSDAKKDLRKLTIGVKTIKKKQNQKNNDRAQSGMGGGSGGRGGSNSGGQGGGPPEGRGGQGGEKGGKPSSSKEMKPSEVEIDFWFAANLKKD